MRFAGDCCFIRLEPFGLVRDLVAEEARGTTQAGEGYQSEGRRIYLRRLTDSPQRRAAYRLAL